MERNEVNNTDQSKAHNDREMPFTLSSPTEIPEVLVADGKTKNEDPQRQSWGNSTEFLMSCIAMSVGLGNVWRFPFTAYENGGGAFLIPYIIVLLVIGKPCYYLETILGQFTSRSSVKIWSIAPVLKGVGWAQMFSITAAATYYCSLMSITLYYLIASFQSQLPWSQCSEEWGQQCLDSGKHDNSNFSLTNSHNFTILRSSAELYFTKTVLKEKDHIDDGIGLPDTSLTLCLFLAWVSIFAVLVRGVSSSGKVAYFLALFPYVILIALLIRACTLEGASNGIIFFIKPDWSKLFEADVWYAAVTQCFFSLAVCFGGIITYASYNDFRHNIYRDVMVVTTMDTLTSLIAGFTIFGILGNLAHELGTDDIGNVVRGGSGLAFISYPDAIAKFEFLPQLFSILFFLMLYVLGIGSQIALIGGIISIINDQFPSWKHWHIVLVTTIAGFCLGTIYCTPGGQFILNLVDYYAVSFPIFIIVILEVTGVFWLYGLENFLDDIEFMLNRRPSIYWRVCWAIVTPLLLITIFLYTIINLTPLTHGTIAYPDSAHAAGWTLLAFGIFQVPFWSVYTIVSKKDLGMPEMILASCKPSEEWGPLNQSNFQAWKSFKETQRLQRNKRSSSKFKQFFYVIAGCESKLD